MSVLTELENSATGFYKDYRAAGAEKISRRDFIHQPSVVATKEQLRWVANHKLKSTLKELKQIAAMVMQPRCG